MESDGVGVRLSLVLRGVRVPGGGGGGTPRGGGGGGGQCERVEWALTGVEEENTAGGMDGCKVATPG